MDGQQGGRVAARCSHGFGGRARSRPPISAGGGRGLGFSISGRNGRAPVAAQDPVGGFGLWACLAAEGGRPTN
eukprot:571757-Lingulodinium_polyedra.AAC.1